MTEKAKTKSKIIEIAHTLAARGHSMNASTLRKALKHQGLRTYKSNWGVLKMVKASYTEAKKQGDIVTAKNVQYAFVRDDGRYAWDTPNR